MPKCGDFLAFQYVFSFSIEKLQNLSWNLLRLCDNFCILLKNDMGIRKNAFESFKPAHAIFPFASPFEPLIEKPCEYFFETPIDPNPNLYSLKNHELL